MNQLPKRLKSIDVFRALTMLLMIFVNDVGSVKGIPAWIDHVKAADDGLGFADTIFPNFLFIVGLSLPFAIRNRMNKGDAFLNISLYILTRSVALLIMGFFHVNLENYDSKSALLPYSIYTIIVTIAFFLIWLDYSPAITKVKKYSLIGTGIALLIACVFLYKGGTAEEPEGMSPAWWGILGIIGWAYLVCDFVFLITKGKLGLLLPVLAVFIAINILKHMDLLPFKIMVIGDASSVTLVMLGIVVSVLYGTLAGKGKDALLWGLFIAIGVGLIAVGFIVRPYADGISKIRATPAWVFICAGIGTLVFTLLIWLIDMQGKQSWCNAIRPAGTSTLTCYLIPYLLYSVYSLIHFKYPAFMAYGAGGIFKSFLVAFVIIILVGFMERKRLRLKI